MLILFIIRYLLNFDIIIQPIKTHRVIIPKIPLTEIDVKEANLESLTDYIKKFINNMKLNKFILIGNSLGGHIGLIYSLLNPNKVKKLILTGSSGLYENSFGGSFPKRGDYNYINDRVNHTFYNPDILTKKYIDEIFSTLNDNAKCLNIITIARSAQRNNLAKKLSGPDARYFRMNILGAHRHKPHVKKFHFTLAGGHVGFVPISGRFDCLIYATISHNMVRTEPRFGQ